MLNSLIRGSLTNRALVVFAAVLLLAVGGYVTATMPVDVFPDLTAPTVTVITEAHGMAPMEVESQVTFPIETAVNGACANLPVDPAMRQSLLEEDDLYRRFQRTSEILNEVLERVLHLKALRSRDEGGSGLN